jgi:hypothetical protein
MRHHGTRNLGAPIRGMTAIRLDPSKPDDDWLQTARIGTFT